MFPPTVEELVPQDHLVRRLKGLVEHAVGPMLRELYEDHGGVPYDPASLLSVEMYGLMLGIRSSRQLEELCRFDARFWFLTGSLKPDHMTLCRFRRRLADHLPELFAKVLEVARKEGLLGMNVVVVDGTKIAGNISQWKRVLEEAENADSGLDPDARLMYSPHKRQAMKGYNAQIAVDQEHRLIVGQTVCNESNDFSHMPEVLDSIQECAGELPEKALADSGYDSAETHLELESRGIEGYVVTREPATFWGLNPDGEPVCPKGHVAKLSGTFNIRGREWERRRVFQCKSCSLRASCAVTHLKSINSPPGVSPAARIRNSHRVSKSENEALMHTRAPTVETVFAQMKGNRKLARFRYKGLPLVKMEFGLECLAYNLERVIRSILWQLKLTQPRSWREKSQNSSWQATAQ